MMMMMTRKTKKRFNSVTPCARITSNIKCTAALGVTIHTLLTLFCSAFALDVAQSATFRLNCLLQSNCVQC